jgi:SAM-dependent methyltransferase
MWNERYDTEEYVYGTEPNDFLVSMADRIPREGKVLSLGEGEGRNAVYLARLGYQVTAVDQSSVGLKKAERLAADNGVSIRTIVANLAEFQIEEESWDGIVSFFCHMSREVRAGIFRQAAAGLMPGGVFILEAFTPEQLEYGTGGPSAAELMMTAKDLREELKGLDFPVAEELIRDVSEGVHHQGKAAVVQILGVKSAQITGGILENSVMGSGR